MEDQDIKFYKWCMTHNSNFFPKVKKLGKNFVVMEKLEVGSKKCREFTKIVDDWNAKNPITKAFIAAGIPDAKNGPLFCTIHVLAYPAISKAWENKLVEVINGLEDENYKWHAKWVYNACCELREMGVINGNVGDIKPANVGERKDGTIIWFDI